MYYNTSTRQKGTAGNGFCEHQESSTPQKYAILIVICLHFQTGKNSGNCFFLLMELNH